MSLSTAPEKRYIGKVGGWLLGSYLLILGVLLIAFMIQAWILEIPASPGTTPNAAQQDQAAQELTPAKPPQAFLGVAQPTSDFRLFLIVLLAGALGSWLHATSSFLAYVGNRDFVSSWTIWYIGRPLIGSVLALIVYFALRGGLLPSANTDAAALSDYGFAAFSGLVGMFSERATKKLADVFEVIFPTSSSEKDPLSTETVKAENPQPTISDLTPKEVPAGQGDAAVKITGTGFIAASVVTVEGKKVEPDHRQKTSLDLTLPAADLAEPGTVTIAITNPKPGGGKAEVGLKVS